MVTEARYRHVHEISCSDWLRTKSVRFPKRLFTVTNDACFATVNVKSMYLKNKMCLSRRKTSFTGQNVCGSLLQSNQNFCVVILTKKLNMYVVLSRQHLVTRNYASFRGYKLNISFMTKNYHIPKFLVSTSYKKRRLCNYFATEYTYTDFFTVFLPFFTVFLPFFYRFLHFLMFFTVF